MSDAVAAVAGAPLGALAAAGTTAAGWSDAPAGAVVTGGPLSGSATEKAAGSFVRLAPQPASGSNASPAIASNAGRAIFPALQRRDLG